MIYVNDHIKKVLNYIGIIGAIICSIAYILVVYVMIVGFKLQQTTTTITFAIVNAGVGLLITNMLRIQGISFARTLPENKKIEEKYYGSKTKDKKNHSLAYFWVTNIIKDVFTKGITVCGSTIGLIYIIIVGSNDWTLLMMAFVNLLLFICFGLLAMSKSYDYYNTIYKNYMLERIKDDNN